MGPNQEPTRLRTGALPPTQPHTWKAEVSQQQKQSLNRVCMGLSVCLSVCVCVCVYRGGAWGLQTTTVVL